MDSYPEPNASCWDSFRQRLGALKLRLKPSAPSMTVMDSSGEEPSFEKHLESLRLSHAAEQLLAREERLFGATPERWEAEESARARLAADRRVLVTHVRGALRRSFDSGCVEALRSAVDAILKDEEQDRMWQGRCRIPPHWRPAGMRVLHDEALRELVEERMNAASNHGDSGPSSVHRQICDAGRQLREDLVQVVQVVKGCYPVEMDICHLYGQLYHRAFSSRLTEVTKLGLEDKDCRVLLRWVNSDYPGLLGNEVLMGHVDSDRLGPLLPQGLYLPLEKQFLSTKQDEVQRCLKLFLKSEEDLWKEGTPPMTTEGCFLSALAIDVLQCVNGAVLETECTLGDRRKAQVVVCLLSEFLNSLKTFLCNVTRSSTGNRTQFLLAYLPCIKQFRDYIVKNTDLFSDYQKEHCLHTLSSVKESAHTCLLRPVHQALKPHYRTKRTSCWLNESLETLLNSLALHLRELQGLPDPCREELVGRLEVEVTVEYVARLLRVPLRLKETWRQQKVAQTMSEDAKRLANVFSEAGSREAWLDDILSRTAEVLRLQELPSIQIAVTSMGMAYPDLSLAQVSSLLKMKSSLTRSDRDRVQETLTDCRKEKVTSDLPARPFFSRVQDWSKALPAATG